MREIEIRDDIRVIYEEINDGEAISLTQEISGEYTDQIILIRPVALELARAIMEIMDKDEKE